MISIFKTLTLVVLAMFISGCSKGAVLFHGNSITPSETVIRKKIVPVKEEYKKQFSINQVRIDKIITPDSRISTIPALVDSNSLKKVITLNLNNYGLYAQKNQQKYSIDINASFIQIDSPVIKKTSNTAKLFGRFDKHEPYYNLKSLITYHITNFKSNQKTSLTIETIYKSINYNTLKSTKRKAEKEGKLKDFYIKEYFKQGFPKNLKAGITATHVSRRKKFAYESSIRLNIIKFLQKLNATDLLK
ncbi:MAG: hypothetical protein GY932_14525 [Arcobacter sp.]|nr:hypothetical protein [Arcobacter sp.]